jgi:hypothetical protein
MTETEMNELVSEFMGLKKEHGHMYPNNSGWCVAAYLHYHSNWEWLIPVWYKFRDLRFDDAKSQFKHADFKLNISYCICYRDIQSAFQSIISGIQWYNQLNKKA